MVLLGIAGRYFCLLLIGLLGWFYISNPMDGVDTAAVCCVVWSMLLGSGKFCLWQEDSHWINRYDGAKHSTIIATLTWLVSALLAGYIFSRLPLADFMIAIASLQLTDWAVWIGLNLIVLVLLATLAHSDPRLGLGISLLQILVVRQAGL